MSYHKIIFTIVILLSSIIIGCSSPTDNGKKDSYLTSSIQEDYCSIVNPQERSKAYKLENYSIDAGWGCECYIPDIYTKYVINNTVKEVSYKISKDEYYGRTEEEIYNFIINHAMTIDEAFF